MSGGHRQALSLNTGIGSLNKFKEAIENGTIEKRKHVGWVKTKPPKEKVNFDSFYNDLDISKVSGASITSSDRKKIKAQVGGLKYSKVATALRNYKLSPTPENKAKIEELLNK